MSGFVDIEAMLLTWLTPVVAAEGAVLVTDVPSPRPDRFVRLWRNGGPAANRILERPLITVDAWAEDSVAAHALMTVVRNKLSHDLAELPLVRRGTEVTGPYWTPDPESGAPRYRFSVQLNVRAAR